MASRPHLPSPRGPLSTAAIAILEGRAAARPRVEVADALGDDDLHLALYLSYQPHYGPLAGVREDREWDPQLLMFRRALEDPFESAIRAAVDSSPPVPDGPIDVRLRTAVQDQEGPSLSSSLAHRGTLAQYREFVQHRSAYHLKEADPHSFGIPRLRGPAKVALVEIQADEYGGGDPTWMHSSLFARTMRALGLDDQEEAYLEQLPGVTLATVNLMSLFGLHRRLRGALVGHLAGFEMTSCIPNRRYGDGLRRLGFDEEATRYFDEHVEADAVHEAVAANDLAGSLIRAEPELEADVVFGARALTVIDAAFAAHLLGSWEEGRSSLFAAAVGSAA